MARVEVLLPQWGSRCTAPTTAWAGSATATCPLTAARPTSSNDESQADGRLVLVIPWMGRYMLGTTDIRFSGKARG